MKKSEIEKAIKKEEKRLDKFFKKYDLPVLHAPRIMLDYNLMSLPLNKKLAIRIKKELFNEIKPMLKQLGMLK